MEHPATTSEPAPHSSDGRVHRGIGRGWARLEAVLALLAIAGAGLLLWRLPFERRAPLQVVAEEHPTLGRLSLHVEGEAAADPRAWIVFLSRLPVELDAASLALKLSGGARRVLPPGSRTILVRADGRVEATPEPLLPRGVLEAVLQAPAGSRLERLKGFVEARTPPLSPRFPSALEGYW